MKTLSGKDFATILERKGWILKRVNGSHHIYIHIHKKQTLFQYRFIKMMI